MACGVNCTEVLVRPPDFSSRVSEYNTQIEFYSNRVANLQTMQSKLESDVVSKIDSCALPNLEIAGSSSELSSVISSVNEAKNDTLTEIDNASELISEYNEQIAITTAEKANYIATAWVTECSCTT